MPARKRKTATYVVWCDRKGVHAKREKKRPSKYTTRMIHVHANSIRAAIRKSGVRCKG